MGENVVNIVEGGHGVGVVSIKQNFSRGHENFEHLSNMSAELSERHGIYTNDDIVFEFCKNNLRLHFTGADGDVDYDEITNFLENTRHPTSNLSFQDFLHGSTVSNASPDKSTITLFEKIPFVESITAVLNGYLTMPIPERIIPAHPEQVVETEEDVQRIVRELLLLSFDDIIARLNLIQSNYGDDVDPPKFFRTVMDLLSCARDFHKNKDSRKRVIQFCKMSRTFLCRYIENASSSNLQLLVIKEIFSNEGMTRGKQNDAIRKTLRFLSVINLESKLGDNEYYYDVLDTVSGKTIKGCRDELIAKACRNCALDFENVGRLYDAIAHSIPNVVRDIPYIRSLKIPVLRSFFDHSPSPCDEFLAKHDKYLTNQKDDNVFKCEIFHKTVGGHNKVFVKRPVIGETPTITSPYPEPCDKTDLNIMAGVYGSKQNNEPFVIKNVRANKYKDGSLILREDYPDLELINVTADHGDIYASIAHEIMGKIIHGDSYEQILLLFLFYAQGYTSANIINLTCKHLSTQTLSEEGKWKRAKGVVEDYSQPSQPSVFGDFDELEELEELAQLTLSTNNDYSGDCEDEPLTVEQLVENSGFLSPEEVDRARQTGFFRKGGSRRRTFRKNKRTRRKKHRKSTRRIRRSHRKRTLRK